MPVTKSLGLLLTETMLGAVTVKLRHRNIDDIYICADTVQIEDMVATMFAVKRSNERYGWVTEAREGEGILVLLANRQATASYVLSSGAKRYALKPSATRHVLGIDQFGDAAAMILNYIIDGILPT